MPFVQPFQSSYRVVWAPFSFYGDMSESSRGLLGVLEDGGNEWFGVGGFI